MKILLVGIASICITLSAFAEVNKCNYKTKVENSSHYNGAPWADGTWKRTRVIPQGPCEKYGEASELECVKKLKRSGYSCYQMTKGNKYRRYDGTMWGGIKKDYSLCFVCY